MTPYVARIDEQDPLRERKAYAVLSEFLLSRNYRRESEGTDRDREFFAQMQEMEPELIEAFLWTCGDRSGRKRCTVRIEVKQRSYGLWLWIITSPSHDDEAKAIAEGIRAHFQGIGWGSEVKIQEVPSLDFR